MSLKKSDAMWFAIGAIALFVLLVSGIFHEALAQAGPLGIPRPSAPAAPPDGFTGWLASQQAQYYRAISTSIRSAKTDGTALYALFGIAFAYGIFHAAGPGHGKAVISSYLVANDEAWRRGVILSFASAFLQALVAVLIVGVAAILLGATKQMMDQTVSYIEIVSYGLIAALGAWLLWVKGWAFIAEWRGGAGAGHHHAHDHAHHGHDHHHHSHDHDHVHDEHCGHSHGPEPAELAGAGGWKRGLTAIFAVGLRPCSGAIIILVFALAQGLFWAGVVATFIMGLGTAITVAAIATLTVTAQGWARRIAASRGGKGNLILRGIEVLAAALVLVFGLTLVAVYLVSGPTPA